MRNKGKIIAILLISIMVVAMIISCDDPMANYSNDEMFDIAFEGAMFALIAYMHQEGIAIVEDDFDDLPIPAEGTSKALERVDLFTIFSENDYFDEIDDVEAELGISSGQAILLSGNIVVTAVKFEIKASVKFNNYKDLPDGTFNIVVAQTDGNNPRVTVNGKVVTIDH